MHYSYLGSRNVIFATTFFIERNQSALLFLISASMRLLPLTYFIIIHFVPLLISIFFENLVINIITMIYSLT